MSCCLPAFHCPGWLATLWPTRDTPESAREWSHFSRVAASRIYAESGDDDEQDPHYE